MLFRWLSGKESDCNPTPVFLPWKLYGQRNLVGYGLWGHEESDRTWQLNTDTNIVVLQSCVSFYLWSKNESATYIHMYSSTFELPSHSHLNALSRVPLH